MEVQFPCDLQAISWGYQEETVVNKQTLSESEAVEC